MTGKGLPSVKFAAHARSKGKLMLACKGAEGKEMHVYLSFMSQERDKFSTNVYLGMVKLK